MLTATETRYETFLPHVDSIPATQLEKKLLKEKIQKAIRAIDDNLALAQDLTRMSQRVADAHQEYCDKASQLQGTKDMDEGNKREQVTNSRAILLESDSLSAIFCRLKEPIKM